MIKWRTDTEMVSLTYFCCVDILKTNRFHVAMYVYLHSKWSQKTSKYAKKISDTPSYPLVCPFVFLSHYWADTQQHGLYLLCRCMAAKYRVCMSQALHCQNSRCPFFTCNFLLLFFPTLPNRTRCPLFSKKIMKCNPLTHIYSCYHVNSFI